MINAADVHRGQLLAAYVERTWGTRVRLVPQTSFAITATAQKVLNNNPRRFELMIVNQGTGTVYVDFGQVPTVGGGIPVGPQGTLNLTAFEDGELVGYDVWIISSAAGNTIDVWEVQG
jgi:hypothetical protein